MSGLATGPVRKTAFPLTVPQDKETRQFLIRHFRPENNDSMDISKLSKAQGCLLGQLAGDALGSLVEFETPDTIRHRYPEGIREMADGGTWNSLAGQPTDDSEMALLLARMLTKKRDYKPGAALAEYQYWLSSGPFDCGLTISAGLQGNPNPSSQANGALMRVSPIGIFGVNHELSQTAKWARQDAALTHPNPVCLQANALFAMAIAHSIRFSMEPDRLYHLLVVWAREMPVDGALMAAVETAASNPPDEYVRQQGWVLIAFQNALYQLLHAPNLEEGVVETVMQGGDTDTNAAICGALLGAVYGREAIPAQWLDCLLCCRPAADNPQVHHPRPECFWPIDALELAEKLIED